MEAEPVDDLLESWQRAFRPTIDNPVCRIVALAQRELLTARPVKVVKKGHAPMAFPSDLRNIDLEKQLRMLGTEIASLKEFVARRGSNRYGDASEAVSGYYADLTNAVSSVLPSLRKQGRMVGSATSNHPAAVAAVGLLVVGLVASLFLKRSSWREPSKIEPSVRKRTASKAASSGAASKKRTASARNAPSEGRKRVDGPMKDATEPKA